MNDDVTPKNDLERQIIAVNNQETSVEEFLAYLQDAQVFLPVADHEPIKNFQRTNKAIPLTVQTEDGHDVLVMFTSPDRAKTFLQDYPGYEGGLLVEFKWVVEKMGQGHGISINPGQTLGIDLADQ
jgi:hypothetical protein